MTSLILSALLACGVAAQDFPERVREPALKQQTVQEAEITAEESTKRGELAGPEVTYEQVMQRPDDVALNYRYALSEIRKGNLRSAAATLERILMVNPDLPKVRLVYAIVLYRLDTLDDSERELQTLQKAKMPASLRRQVESYLKDIRHRRRRTHLDGVLAAGFDTDDNRNAAPASGQRLFFDTPITLNESSTRKADTAATMLGSVTLLHDLGYQEGHSLFADYSYYRAEQTKQKILNLQNHAADAGFTYKAGWADVTGIFEFDHLLLAQTTYLRSEGERLRLERKTMPRITPFLEAAYTRQLYSRTQVVVNGSDRTGDKIEGTVGASYLLSPTRTVFGTFSHVEQGAAADFLAYRREALQLGHNWLLRRGQFLLVNGNFDYDHYRASELAVSQKNRRDWTIRARATYGLSLGALAASLKPATFTFSYEYYQALSNLTNYSYTNNKISLLLLYKWGF